VINLHKQHAVLKIAIRIAAEMPSSVGLNHTAVQAQIHQPGRYNALFSF